MTVTIIRATSVRAAKKGNSESVAVAIAVGGDHAVTGVGIGGTGAGIAGAGEDPQDKCPICFDPLTDPIAPCQVPGHKLCRECVKGFKEKGVNNRCPQCRGELTDVEELHFEAIMLNVLAVRL